MQIETVKVKSPMSEDNDTGHIVINKSDFVEGVHELFVEGDEGVTKKAELTVAQIKEALVAKNVIIPEGVTKKAELQALLDANETPA